MTILLTLGVAVTHAFATDWSTRAGQILLRCGTTGKWVRRALRHQASIAVAAVVTLAALVVVTRYAATGMNPLPSPGHDILLLLRLMIVTMLVTALLTAVVVVTGSEVAPIVLAAIVLVIGAIPSLNVMWNPVLAWSARWQGSTAVGAAVAGVIGIVVVIAGLLLSVRIRKEPKVHRVTH